MRVWGVWWEERVGHARRRRKRGKCEIHMRMDSQTRLLSWGEERGEVGCVEWPPLKMGP